MKKVVVFGGSGFIGSHTVDELSRNGYSVTIFDNKPSKWLKKNQTMVVGSILDSSAVAKVLKNTKIIYNFAGIADIARASSNPLDTINFNVMGTTIILEEAIKAKVNRFVFASTMYVYSDKGSIYRASKQAAEAIIEVYHKKYGLEYTFLRYGSLYGPRAQEWNGIRKWVKQVVENDVMHYEGTGNERREYIHVYDAARLSVDILDTDHKNQAITVTGHQVLHSSELIRMIFEIVGKPTNVKMSDTNEDGDHYETTPYRYIPKEAKKLIPEEFIDLGQGILNVVEEIYLEKNSITKNPS